MPNDPADATSLLAMVALTCVGPATVVGRGVPFQSTVAPVMKFEPLIVRVKPPLCALTLTGVSEVSAGTGFGVTASTAVTSPAASLAVFTSPPPETAAVLVSDDGALPATVTVTVMAG